MNALIKRDIQELSQQLTEHPGRYEAPTKHYFLDGMYCRECFVLAGSTGVGKLHKKASFNLLTEGTILVSNGEQEVILKAPQIFMGSAGKQKIGHALTDVVWVNIFRTDATTVTEAEQELFE